MIFHQLRGIGGRVARVTKMREVVEEPARAPTPLLLLAVYIMIKTCVRHPLTHVGTKELLTVDEPSSTVNNSCLPVGVHEWRTQYPDI